MAVIFPPEIRKCETVEMPALAYPDPIAAPINPFALTPVSIAP
jgi:hypothetical protein